MWERARETMTDDQLAERSELLQRLGDAMHSAARELDLVSEGCRRVCKEHLEIVDGRLQRVVVCKIVCD